MVDFPKKHLPMRHISAVKPITAENKINFGVPKRVIRAEDASRYPFRKLTSVLLLGCCAVYTGKVHFCLSRVPILTTYSSLKQASPLRKLTCRMAGIRWDRHGHRHRHGHPRRLVRHAARFSSRGCPLGMRACRRAHVCCTR